MGVNPPVPCPRLFAQRGGALSDQPKLAERGGKLHRSPLVAPNDLPYPRVIESD